MHLGDLVKFIEKHKNGLIKETIGLVIERKGDNKKPEKPIYRVKWFEEETPDSWHISPDEDETPRDFYIISSAENVE
tara:strand:+ start:295 stop:525 length:231 start_codon:yes stop_codon:yes gene_type:complete